MGVWFTAPVENNFHGTALQTLETFREQVMHLCIKVIDPQESELVKELIQLCAQLGDVEAVIYCTKLVVPFRWDVGRLQAMVGTLREWSEEDMREPCEDPKELLNELFRLHGVVNVNDSW